MQRTRRKVGAASAEAEPWSAVAEEVVVQRRQQQVG
jgi:hypothetical protein